MENVVYILPQLSKKFVMVTIEEVGVDRKIGVGGRPDLDSCCSLVRYQTGLEQMEEWK
jgi:hypothetical protein